ncbi:uncharacterized protein MYCFIDRAFT_77787 [Pseudocercospora fijiensis CIRAD86]|uniref:Uncharacterized protein n=1 Tax=Pseudocercospora fijiensis (strain CIRAD86) TaxID=383855 RepID=M2ZLN9_PSEFD|nr:uncharacterized protein MYCFIDRAFT_77787 [Pseudocercospora fijiensis CIRAD86]EME79989.1 hypothetical protein MYCFIDRAFT_77787 [Pseudocercospora fijiensis CIRAD86]
MAHTGAGTQQDPYVIEDDDILFEALAPLKSLPPANSPQARGVSPGGTHSTSSPGVISARALPNSGAVLDMREPCRQLFDLPQEMVDMIFNFAYPTVENFRIKSFRRWESDHKFAKEISQAFRNSHKSSIKAYPGHKINDFLGVNKAFFYAAASAYIRNQTWELSAVADAVKILDFSCTTLVSRPSFLSRHIETLTVCHATSDLVVRQSGTDAFPALKSIEYRPGTYTVQLNGARAVRDIFTDEELAATMAFQTLKKVRGLTKFSVIADAPPPWQDAVVSGVWEANMRRMEVLLRPIVTQPKVMTRQMASSDVVTLGCCQPSDLAILGTLMRKESPRKAGEQFREDVLERTDAVVVDAFIKDPAGFVAWAREVKRAKDTKSAAMSG